ncbi:TIGR02450 family Trp-rich protein [Aeromonas sp. 601115]|uniref:TIGR02450 family Trp-rich protein n=1 Tax=Aeromonas sp. 601115 TaxID=2712038 RepID=UPI003BA0B8CF
MTNTFSTDSLLFSKWTKEGQHELTDRFYLVVACQRDAQGQLVQVVMQDINTLQEQEMDWHELEDPNHWHMGWN